MAYIQLKLDEMDYFKSLNLPDGTRILASDLDEQHLFVYEISEGEWVVEVDFQEQGRQFRDEDEKKAFTDTLTRENVVDFFLKGSEVDNVPFREFEVRNEFEFQNFKYLRSAGSYDMETGIGFYYLTVPRSFDLLDLEKEFKFVVERMRHLYPDLKEFRFPIMEHSCALYYDLIYLSDDDIYLRDEYDHKSKLHSLKEAFTYISNHLWYG